MIYISIAFIVSIHFVKNYYKTKNREILLARVALLGLTSPWIPAAITFLVIILTNGTLNTEVYLNITIIGAFTVFIFIYIPLFSAAYLCYYWNPVKQRLFIGSLGLVNIGLLVIFAGILHLI